MNITNYYLISERERSRCELSMCYILQEETKLLTSEKHMSRKPTIESQIH